MKINPIKILKYSLLVIILCVIVLQFVKPGVSVTAPVFIVVIGAIALGAAQRKKKDESGGKS